MNPQANEPPWLGILCGIAFLLFGVEVFIEARTADASHDAIPAHGHTSAWMTPVQGYLASSFLVVLGGALVVLYSRIRRRK